MFQNVTTEMHARRRSRNLGVAACLLGFIVLLFLLTAVKIQEAGHTQGFDHVVRPELLPVPSAATTSATSATSATGLVDE